MTVGTSPLGLSFRYSGSRLPPNGPPWSTRSWAMFSSAQVHNTFCTFDDVVRPQIFSMPSSAPRRIMEPQILGVRNSRRGVSASPGLGYIAAAFGDPARGFQMIHRTASAAFFIAALLPAAAMATGPGVASLQRWNSMDRCTVAAQKGHPDNTVESLAQRDAALRLCLAGGNLPPRETQSLPPGTK